ncbi:MAG TPA: hypothetical protein VGL77_04725, partial [Armatimonadota bacterium]
MGFFCVRCHRSRMESRGMPARVVAQGKKTEDGMALCQSRMVLMIVGWAGVISTVWKPTAVAL